MRHEPESVKSLLQDNFADELLPLIVQFSELLHRHFALRRFHLQGAANRLQLKCAPEPELDQGGCMLPAPLQPGMLTSHMEPSSLLLAVL